MEIPLFYEAFNRLEKRGKVRTEHGYAGEQPKPWDMEQVEYDGDRPDRGRLRNWRLLVFAFYGMGMDGLVDDGGKPNGVFDFGARSERNQLAERRIRRDLDGVLSRVQLVDQAVLFDFIHGALE
jgi:hypothetical protein